MAISPKMRDVDLNVYYGSSYFIQLFLEFNPDMQEKTVAYANKYFREKTNSIFLDEKEFRKYLHGQYMKHDDLINALVECGLDKRTLLYVRTIGNILKAIADGDTECNAKCDAETYNPTMDKIYFRLDILLKLAEEIICLIDELESDCTMDELSTALTAVIKHSSPLVYKNYSKKLKVWEEKKKMEKKIHLINTVLCVWKELSKKVSTLSESETDVQEKVCLEEYSTMFADFTNNVQDILESTGEYDKFSQIVKSEFSTYIKTLSFKNYMQNRFSDVKHITRSYPSLFIPIAHRYITQHYFNSHPEFSLKDLSEIEMLNNPSEYVHSIMEATFKDYKTLIELTEFHTKTYHDDSERKEQAIELCKKIECNGEYWVNLDPQDRFLVQLSHSLFVNTLKILSEQEFCECLDICSAVLDIIFDVDLETYLLPEKSADTEIIDLMLVNKFEANLDELDELDEKRWDDDFDEGDYDFQDACDECYDALVEHFNLGDNMSTCNRRYIIRKAYEFFVEQTSIKTENEFAEDFCFYSDNNNCDIINTFELEIQTV